MLNINALIIRLVIICLQLLLLQGLICEEGSLKCSDEVHCYLSHERCDGHVDCVDASDEVNCTATDPSSKSNANLAWLVTPCLFLLGLFYAVGRCIYDGVCCNRSRLVARMRNLSGDSGSSQRRSWFSRGGQLSIRTSTQLPLRTPSQQGDQFLLIHDQSFSITLAPHSTDLVPPDRIRLPTYEEATSVPLMAESELPSYTEVAGGTSPPQYTSSADVFVSSQSSAPSRPTPVDRRRHRSQQEPSRRSSFSLGRRRHRSQEAYTYTSLLESEESL